MTFTKYKVKYSFKISKIVFLIYFLSILFNYQLISSIFNFITSLKYSRYNKRYKI